MKLLIHELNNIR